jgi:hypothetical protein
MRKVFPVLLALTLVPCASAGLPNPCTLLTNAQVSGLLGTKVASRADRPAGIRARMCRWVGRNGLALTVILAQRTKAEYEQSARDTPRSIRVNGIGDAAFTVPKSEGGFLVVWRAGYALELSATLGKSQLPVEESAARSALRRL